MRPELRRFGNSNSVVVVIDDFSGSAEDIARLADALTPFPALKGNYYPGVRRVITEADANAYEYVLRTCRNAAPFIGGAFEVEGFDLVEGSFSIVSLQPDELRPVQRAPHFDSPDPKYYALLHYLRVPPGTGTAFYRQRSTGIERVTEQNIATFIRTAKGIEPLLPKESGYVRGSNEHYEQMGAVEAVPDRMIIYQGSLLHSGIIPPGMPLSADPGEGRLTANIFVRGR